MSVLLGVAGGIAAYKSAELARALMERGQSVQVLMTRAAQEFVRPLTFAALTGRKVLTDMFVIEDAIEHIKVTQENDALVVAPATADVMAKFAVGIADDFLTTVYLAFTGPVVLAPAMNTNMWQHPATQRNIETLRARGHVIVGPEGGELACRMVGPGRLAEPERIADAVLAALQPERHLGLYSSPPAPPRKPSTRCDSCPTAPAAVWGTPWPKSLRAAAPRSCSCPGP
jgi:phosphopantothenoylcysteine decarboxylase/phosphopantothenate--cysteine ligase